MRRVHIKKNDLFMCCWKRPGQNRQGAQSFCEKQRAIVEGLNQIHKHTRPNPQKNVKGGILPKNLRSTFPSDGCLQALQKQHALN